METLSYELLQEIVSASSLGVLVADASGPSVEIVYANAAYSAASGYSADELIGTDWLAYAAASDDSEEIVELRRRIVTDESFAASLPLLDRDGEIWLARFDLRPLRAADDDRRMLLIQLDKAEGRSGDATGPEFLKRALGFARRKIASLDRVDQVTGLMSRSQFETFLRRDLAIARREGNELGVLVFDVAELDIYRTTFGHNAADSCLRMIGAQISGTFRRSGDLCARLDESTICVVVRDQTAEQSSRLGALIEKKVRNLGLHNPRGNLSRYIVVRSSFVTADPASEDVDQLLSRALDARNENPPEPLFADSAS
ncbi:MAG: diguanylate cyclase [Gammaproteobacteria bacterium]|nr:diguanylate cyclase [Gammaproteobacteria bacterium]